MNTFVASTLALLTVAVVALGLTVLALMRQVGTVLLHVAPPRPGVAGGPEIGAELPAKLEAELVGASGAILVFLGAHCPACTRVEPVLPTLSARYPELRFVPIAVAESQLQRDQHLARLSLAGRSDCQELLESWNIPGTPFAVGIDGSRHVVASGVVNSLDHLEALATELIMGPMSAASDESEATGYAAEEPMVA